MTVGELIRELDKYDKNTFVYIEQSPSLSYKTNKVDDTLFANPEWVLYAIRETEDDKGRKVVVIS